MHDTDRDYIQRLLDQQAISGPVLEFGTGYGGANCRDLVSASGLAYFGTDMHEGLGVDFVANLDHPGALAVFAGTAPFGTLLILNVLEHVFDPIRFLDAATTLLKPGGSLVLLTPAVWPLHDFPMDAWRILPNFYEEYARRRGLTLDDAHFEYVGGGLVQAYRNSDGGYRFPPPVESRAKRLWGRTVHKIFNTFGRGMFQPTHLAVAALLRIPEDGDGGSSLKR